MNDIKDVILASRKLGWRRWVVSQVIFWDDNSAKLTELAHFKSEKDAQSFLDTIVSYRKTSDK